MRNWTLPLTIGGIAVATGIAVLAYSGYTLDDSYITYRYAEHIAAGDGFVYNLGERELGTTTPLYTVLLAAFVWLGAPTAWAAKTLGIAAFGGTAALTVRLSAMLGAPRAVAALTGLAACVFPPLLRDAVSGMETALYACLVLAVMVAALGERWRWFTVLGGVLFLVRPDGVLALVACGLFDLLRGGRLIDWIKRAVGVLFIGAPWFVFAYSYFGLLFPNSGFAKMLQTEDWGHFLVRFGEYGLANAVLVPLVALGVVEGVRRDRRVLLVALFCAVYIGFYGGLSFPGCGWYFGPLHAPILILAGMGATLLLGTPDAPRWALWAALGSVAAVRGVPAYEEVRQIKKDQVNVETHHKALGDWLRENTAIDAVVAADNIGYIGYFSERRIICMLGLVQSEIREGLERTGNLCYALESRVPEYLAIQNRGATPKYTPPDSWFRDHGYTIVFTAPYSPERAYHVFQRPPR